MQSDRKFHKLTRKKAIVLLVVVAIALPLCLGAGQVIYTRITGDIFSGVEFSKAYTDRDGKLLQVFLTSDDKYRIYKPISSFPPEFLDLLMLQEDQYFYGHNGFNIVSLLKGFYQTYIVRSGRVGGSTITMQAAKLKYKIYTRNIPGKIHQIVAAIFLEMCYSKQDIFELYLNLVPCGKNLEGFEAGSWYYFNKTVTRLNVSEDVMLCVLPQNPTDRAPSLSYVPSSLVAARKELFSKWVEDHPEDSDIQVFMDMAIPLVCKMPDEVRHFTQMLSTQSVTPLASVNKRSRKTLEAVQTTIDIGLQKKCESYLNAHLNKYHSRGVNNAALLLVDNQTMEVLANIGSANFYDDAIEGQVNATTAKRSPGSTLKPFIYALALEQGIIHSNTMLKDTPVSFNEYAPDNYGSVFKGPLAAWFALVDSRNIPAIALASQIRNPDLYDYMIKAGVSQLKDKNHYGLSIVLGSADVSMLELTEMYTAIANGGIQKKLRFTMEQMGGEEKRMLTEESAYIVRRMLEKNVPPYQTRPAEVLNTPIAYKTGTSVGFKDCWTVAIFDRYTICVWVGNFDGMGNNSFLGRTMAAPLAFNIADSMIMDTIAAVKAGQKPYKYPDIPDNVCEIDVCAVSGALPTENCTHLEKAWFIPGVSPIAKCKIHRKINIDTRTGYRTDETDKPYVRTVVREFWPSDLQSLFEQAGLPRLIPPSYPDDEFRYDVASQGYPPEIISPMANTNYIFRTDDDSKNQLVLSAVADADSEELLWFCDDIFIARSIPGGKVIWKPEAGSYNLTVSDTKGRSSTILVNVLYDWQVNASR